MAACKALSPDFGAVIAIDVSVQDSVIDIGDTARPNGFAVNGRGDPAQATLVWSSLDTTIRVVDTTTGAAVGVSPGPGRLVARVGALASNPALVNVLGTFDSVAVAGPDSVAVSQPNSVSDSLLVKAISGGTPSAHRKITLSVVFPPGGTGVTLIPGDTIVTAGPLGTAWFQVQFTGVRPESVVVSASGTYHGTSVAGSPIRFIVEFLP